MSCNCTSTCIDPKEQELQKIIEKYKGMKGALIPVLLLKRSTSMVKEDFRRMNVPLAEITGGNLYTQFSLQPKENTRSRFVLVQPAMLRAQDRFMIN